MELISPTLYINHICDKIGIQELKRTLFSSFSKFGTILEICAHKGLKRRGQAWITFSDIESARNARAAFDGYFLFKDPRPISVHYAKAKSQITQKITGSWNPYGRKAERISEIEAKELVRGAIPKYYDFDMESDDEDEQFVISADVKESVKPEESTKLPVVPTIDTIPPNNVLFVQNLFDSVEETRIILDMFFGQYRGYKEARILPDNPRIAFVEFEAIEQATLALGDLNGTELNTNQHMLIQYSKRDDS
ncbi:hypothetical protein M9Y10_040777 [Tritrichomonas musculus]|uniref:RRM domain-containing protein n=1 Tax=Tritrichomonas musculus TaxID=1915356 RepID=A0ABR2K327_9EUKA